MASFLSLKYLTHIKLYFPHIVQHVKNQNQCHKKHNRIEILLVLPFATDIGMYIHTYVHVIHMHCHFKEN